MNSKRAKARQQPRKQSGSRGVTALLIAAVLTVLGVGAVTYVMLEFTNAPIAGGDTPEPTSSAQESTSPGQQISGQYSEPGGSHNSPSSDESEDVSEETPEESGSQDELGSALPASVNGYTLDWSGSMGTYSKGPFDQITVMQYAGLTKLSDAALLFKDGTRYELDDGRGVCGELAGTQCYLETKRFGLISVTGLSDAAPTAVPAVAKAILGKIP